MSIPIYIGFVAKSERLLHDAYTQVSGRHERDAGVRDGCMRLAGFTRDRISAADELAAKFGGTPGRDARFVRDALFRGLRVGGFGLIRDLHDLSLLANQSLLYWTALYQGMRALHDAGSESFCQRSILSVEREISWLTTQIKEAAPQALTIPPDRINQLITIGKKIPTSAVLPDGKHVPLKAAALTSAGLVGFLLGRRRSA